MKIMDLDKLNKIKTVLGFESDFYIMSIIYGIAVSLFTLAIPVSVQSLINTVTFGVILQPLVILSIVLFGLLLFSSLLKALQTFTIESFQQHFYVRLCSDITSKLLDCKPGHLNKVNKSDLVNRYFDIMTVQKSVSTLLVGGVSLVMQIGTGLLLLAFYHPYFLIFDVILIFCLYVTWKILSKKGLSASVKESKAKYEMAYFLDEIVGLSSFAKSLTRRKQIVKRSDKKIKNYILNRRKHFNVLFKQHVLLLIIYSFMSAIILGLGGYLVIKQELSIGQLVAAELVVTVILASLSKAHKYIESYYDLYAAIDKLYEFYKLPAEDNIEKSIKTINSAEVSLKKVEVSLGTKKYFFDKKFNAGKKYLINSNHYTYKNIFLDLLNNNRSPDRGAVFIGDHHYHDISPSIIRENICIINKANNIEGTVKENLKFGLSTLDLTKARKSLETNDLNVIQEHFVAGLSLDLNQSGFPLWSNQIFRLELAKVLLSNSPVIVISKFFDQIGYQRRKLFLEQILKTNKTFILISDHAYPEFTFDEYLSFENGEIITKSKKEVVFEKSKVG